MKKLKKSVKIILTISASLVCVAAIVLGCIFGFKKKPGEPGGGGNIPSNFTASQQALANEIKNAQFDMNYEVSDVVPYSEWCEYEQITMMGDNYFAFKNNENQEEFVAYQVNGDGSVKTNLLTDYTKRFVTDVNANFSRAISYGVSSITDNYVVLKTTFEKQASEIDSSLRYSLVYFADIANPVEIFSFDSTNKEAMIPTGIELNKNYFLLSTVSNCDVSNGVGDCDIYYSNYSTTAIENVSKLTTKYDINKTFSLRTSENMFFVQSDNLVKIVYLKDGDFQVIEKTVEKNESGALLSNYNFIELTNNKFAIIKENFVLSQDDITESSVIIDTTAQGNAYANYEYFVYDYSGDVAEEKAFPIEKGYSIVNVPERDVSLTNNFYVSYQKIEDNKPSGKHLVCYFDDNLKQVVKFEAKEIEKIEKIGNTSFVTNNQILKADGKVKVSSIVTFGDGSYERDELDTSGKIGYIPVSKEIDGKVEHGILNNDGEIVVDLLNSNLMRVISIKGDECVYLNRTRQLHKINLKTKEDVAINKDIIFDSVINSKNAGVYLVDDGETNSLYSVKDGLIENNITSLVGDSSTTSMMRGDVYYEIETDDGKKLVRYTDKLKDTSQNVLSVVSNQAPAAAPADLYASTSATISNGSMSISRDKNPQMYITMDTKYKITSASISLHFFNDYTLSISGTNTDWYNGISSDNNYTVSYSYGGDWHTSIYAYMESYKIKYYCRFSYTNWLGYGSVGFNSSSYSVSTSGVKYYADFYGYDGSYDANANDVRSYTLQTYHSYYIGSSTGSGTLPTEYISYAFAHGWDVGKNYNTDAAYTNDHIGPTYYSSARGCVYNGSRKCYLGDIGAPGASYSVPIDHYLSTCFFAEYTENKVTLTLDGSSTTYGVTATTNAYSVGSDITGYTWGGWSFSGCQNGVTHYANYYDSTGTFIETKEFEGDSFKVPMVSGASTVTFQWLRTDHGNTVTATSYYNPVVYTITIDKVNGTGGTDVIYLHYSVGMYLTYDTSTTPPTLSNAMTASANPISAISRHGYTFAGVRLTDNSPVFIQSNNYIISTYSKTLVSADTTVYAVWTANTYTVVYYTTDTTTTSITASYDVAFNAPTPTKEFYYFTGWTISNAENSTDYPSYYGSSSSATTSFTGTSKTLGSSYLYFKNLRSTTDTAAGSAANNTVTLTPNWAGNKYYIDYDANNGVFTDSQMNNFYNYTKTTDEALGLTGTSTLFGMGVQYYKYDSTAAYLAFVYLEDIDKTGPLLISTVASGVYYVYTSGLLFGVIQNDCKEVYSTQYTFNGYNYYVSSTKGWDDGNKLSYVEKNRITFTASNMSSAVSMFMNNYKSSFYGRSGYYHYGSRYSTIEPTRTGYTFAGWTVSGMDSVTTHNFYNSSNTVVKTSTTTSVTVDATAKKFANLRGSTGVVKMVARWTPNTYKINYVLTSSDGLAVGAWQGNETHPTTATYDQWFYLDNVFQSEKSWPLGYYFNGWTISGQNGTWYAGSSTSASARTTTAATNLSASTKYFKNLHSTNGATITLTARWEPYSYDLIYQANGEHVTLNSSSATSVKFNSWGTVYNPSRIGFTFAGWEVLGLSDEISHQISYNAGSNVTTFDSVNGFYANPANPNKAILLYDTYGKNYFKLKNFHYVSGADVILKAIWTPNDYTVTYYYSNDSVWNTNPTLAQLNLSSNMTLSKTQTVTFSQYFTTFGVGNNETQANVVTVPTGYKLKGWLILTSTISNTTVTNLSSSYVVGANTEVLYNYTFATAHTTSGMTVGNLYAYAVYEAVVFTLVYYAPDNTTGVLGDLSTYKDVATATVAYGSSFTTPTVFGEYPVSSYMISSNLYNAGEIFNAVNGCSFAGVDYVFYAGLTVVWGLSNAKAKYPENPVFYAYMEYNEDYVGTLTKLSFEYTLAGYAVSAIDKTISGNVKIPKMYDDGVHGPLKVYAIDSYGFSGCTSMTSIDMGSITVIDDGGLKGCTGLSQVNFPETLTTIGEYSLSGCTGLSKLHLTKNIKSIYNGRSFNSCTGLTSITVDSENPYFDSRNNCNAIIREDSSGNITVVVACNNTVFPTGVTDIGDNAYYGRTLTSITIPATVKTIGMDAFYGCSKLTTVNFATGSVLKSIYNYAFEDCSKLTGITLPDSVTSISGYAFSGTGLISMVLPANLATIGRNAFDSCTSLKEIYIPKSVKTIVADPYGYRPFSNCSNSLVIYCEAASKPDGWDAEWDSRSSGKFTVYWGASMPTISKLTFTASGTGYAVSPGSDMSGKVVIPASYNGKTVTSIDGFEDNTTITELIIYGNGVTIATYAFRGSTALKKLSLFGNILFGSYTFKECSALETVLIGNGVKELDTYTFDLCTALKVAYISSSVTTAGPYVFDDCLSTLVLNCEHSSQPSGFNGSWNVYAISPTRYLTINWGQTIPTSI